MDAASGAAKAFAPGHGVAGDPNADEILVQRNAASGVQLVRVALATRAETPVLVAGGAAARSRPARPAARSAPTAGSSCPPCRPRRGCPRPAILEPSTGALTLVPVTAAGDVLTAAWGRSGTILAMALGTNGEFWSFRPKDAGAPARPPGGRPAYFFGR